MSVCASRTDSPGFFTSCAQACRPDGCRCAVAVKAELEAAAIAEPSVVEDCEDCEWVEVRALCEPEPQLVRGRPCEVHA